MSLSSMRQLLTALLALAAIGCGEKTTEEHVPRVRTAVLEYVATQEWTLSGTVRARVESPLAFRVGGQILGREVSSGERVRKGQQLMTLDAQDLREQLTAARAQLESARAEAENARAESERARRLQERQLISSQAADNIHTAADAAMQRVLAAEATLRQAENAIGYATLRAPADGIITEVTGEPGQVVAAGQAVAILAQDGPREVEIFVPHERRNHLPQQARVELGNGDEVEASLREVSGAADAFTRTWRARYQLPAEADPGLGSIARLRFNSSLELGTPVFRVPIGALSERGEGARLWLVRDGVVHAVPVKVVSLDLESAYVAGPVAAGMEVVALGTHLLTDGQRVRTAP